MRRMIFLALALVAGALLLAGCSNGAAESNGSVDAVNTYLNALMNKDLNAMIAASCADWEESATLELDAFQAVTTRLEDVSCSETSREGSSAVVTCQGQIAATYNNEDQFFSLADRPYKVVEEGGEWRVCGYQ